MSACPKCGSKQVSVDWANGFACGTLVDIRGQYHHTVNCRRFSELRKPLDAQITTLQTQLDQHWEMMRALEVECGTKDVEEAVNFIKGLKARYGAVEKFADELAECASQIGWTSFEDATWIRRAESAVSAYRKAKGHQ